jgi:hypothetical protein
VAESKVAKDSEGVHDEWCWIACPHDEPPPEAEPCDLIGEGILNSWAEDAVDG